MDASVRLHVRRCAGNCYEYCRFPEEYAAFTPFHVEHIVAKQHGGGDYPSNLALACHHCNQHKGPNLSGIDPPRRRWSSYSILASTIGPNIFAGMAQFSLGAPPLAGLPLPCFR